MLRKGTILVISVFLIFSIGIFFQNLTYGLDEKLVILHTKSGDIIIEFFPDKAPNHVDNFIKLTESGFYDGTLFHRIIPGFMIQGGDVNSKQPDKSSWGSGNPGYSLNAEFNDIKHIRGIVSMARSSDPNSAGSQFFIVHGNSNFLDGKYSVFGRIITPESFETLDKIAALATATNDVPLQPEEAKILSSEVLTRSEFNEPDKVPSDTKVETPKVPVNDAGPNAAEVIKKNEPSGGCLIATATYGSELSPQVQQLRELRDNVLLQTNFGSSFMTGFNQFYYSFSPTIADWERQNSIFKDAVYLAITPLISSLSLLNYIEMDSESDVLGYGISLILLNIGMYVGTPIGIGLVLIRKIRNIS